MNAETAESFRDAFLEMREAFGVPLVVSGREVVAIINESSFGTDLVSGGLVAEGEVEAKILAADVADLAKPLDLDAPAAYKNRNFRISHIAQQPQSFIIELRLRPMRGR